MCHDLEWFLPRTPGGSAANGGARCSALDRAAGWRGANTAGIAGRIAGADSGQHGCVDHRASGAGLEAMVLLRGDGDVRVSGRGAGDVSVGAQRRQGNIKEESFGGASGKDHRNFLAVGILVDCDSGIAAAAGADGAVRDCRGSHTVSHGEIPGGADAGKGDSVQLAGVTGGALWEANYTLHCSSRASIFVSGFRSGGDCRGDYICSAVGAEKAAGTRLASQVSTFQKIL